MTAILAAGMAGFLTVAAPAALLIAVGLATCLAFIACAHFVRRIDAHRAPRGCVTRTPLQRYTLRVLGCLCLGWWPFVALEYLIQGADPYEACALAWADWRTHFWPK